MPATADSVNRTRTRPARFRLHRRLAATGLAAAAAATLLVAAPGASANAGACPGAATPITQAGHLAAQSAVVCLVNAERTERHLPKLVVDPRLDRSAQHWTDSMVADADFSHGAAFAERISAAGFDWSQVGENIATGYVTPQAVVNAWMASPGHCANILDPAYREVGTGVMDDAVHGASSAQGTWTQDFGRLMGQPALSHDAGPARACAR